MIGSVSKSELLSTTTAQHRRWYLYPPYVVLDSMDTYCKASLKSPRSGKVLVCLEYKVLYKSTGKSFDRSSLEV